MSFDAPPEPCSCGVPDCPCGRCHGVGWVFVTESYAKAQFPDPPIDLLTAVPPEAQAHLHEQVRLARAGAMNSAYPCRACNATQFFRWREGHLSSDHARGECPECTTATPRRRRVNA